MAVMMVWLAACTHDAATTDEKNPASTIDSKALEEANKMREARLAKPYADIDPAEQDTGRPTQGAAASAQIRGQTAAQYLDALRRCQDLSENKQAECRIRLEEGYRQAQDEYGTGSVADIPPRP